MADRVMHLQKKYQTLNNERYMCILVLDDYLETVSQGQDEAESCLRKLLSGNCVFKLQFSPQLLLLFTQWKRRGQGVILEERDWAGSVEENNSLGFSILFIFGYFGSLEIIKWYIIFVQMGFCL